jgi:hypothetical protein
MAPPIGARQAQAPAQHQQSYNRALTRNSSLKQLKKKIIISAAAQTHEHARGLRSPPHTSLTFRLPGGC